MECFHVGIPGGVASSNVLSRIDQPTMIFIIVVPSVIHGKLRIDNGDF